MLYCRPGSKSLRPASPHRLELGGPSVAPSEPRHFHLPCLSASLTCFQRSSSSEQVVPLLVLRSTGTLSPSIAQPGQPAHPPPSLFSLLPSSIFHPWCMGSPSLSIVRRSTPRRTAFEVSVLVLRRVVESSKLDGVRWDCQAEAPVAAALSADQGLSSGWNCHCLLFLFVLVVWMQLPIPARHRRIIPTTSLLLDIWGDGDRLVSKPVGGASVILSMQCVMGHGLTSTQDFLSSQLPHIPHISICFFHSRYFRISSHPSIAKRIWHP